VHIRPGSDVYLCVGGKSLSLVGADGGELSLPVAVGLEQPGVMRPQPSSILRQVLV
jgi:hypothetical protein